MSANSPSKSESDHLFVGGMALFLVFALAWFFWMEFHTDLVYWSMWLDWHVLTGLSWAWSPSWLSDLRTKMADAAANASLVSPSQLWSILNHGGLVLLPVLLAILALLARMMWKHPSNHVRRAIDPSRLRWIMAKHAPAIIPTLYYPNLLKNDPPEFRSFDSPEEWALKHRVVINKRLDRERTRALLTEALGTRLSSLDELSPHEKALFAVFGARLLSDGADIAVAQELLDKLNFSCHTGTFEGRPGYPDLLIAEPYFRKYAAHPAAKEWLAVHGFSRTLLHAMHQEAITKGKVPSSHFIWLYTMDRGLFAALNTSCRKTPFVESVAVFTQTRWEKFAQNLGLTLTEAHLDDAIDALSAYLEKVGVAIPSAKSKQA